MDDDDAHDAPDDAVHDVPDNAPHDATYAYLEELYDKILVVSDELLAERQAAEEMHEYLDELLAEQCGHDARDTTHDVTHEYLDELLNEQHAARGDSGTVAILDHACLANIARAGGQQRVFSMVDKTLSKTFTSGFLLNHTAMKGIKIFESDLEGWKKYLTRKRKIAVIAGLNFQMFYPMKEYSLWDEDDETEFVLDPKQIPPGFEIETGSSIIERG